MRAGVDGNGHQDLQKLREDVYPPGGSAALAGLLPGLPGEGPAGGDDHQAMPPLREGLHVRLLRKALAEDLPVLPGEAGGAMSAAGSSTIRREL